MTRWEGSWPTAEHRTVRGPPAVGRASPLVDGIGGSVVRFVMAPSWTLQRAPFGPGSLEAIPRDIFGPSQSVRPQDGTRYENGRQNHEGQSHQDKVHAPILDHDPRSGVFRNMSAPGDYLGSH